MSDSELQSLWANHRQMPFPSAAKGVEVEGIDLGLMDSLVAGCISSLLDTPAGRESEKLTLLARLAPQVRTVSVQLGGEVGHYFSRLCAVADATLRAESHRK